MFEKMRKCMEYFESLKFFGIYLLGRDWGVGDNFIFFFLKLLGIGFYGFLLGIYNLMGVYLF